MASSVLKISSNIKILKEPIKELMENYMLEGLSVLIKTILKEHKS
jgi:hypothetical protein